MSLNEPHSTWIFTFGHGHKYPNRYIKITGTHDGARAIMSNRFGAVWAFQYPESREESLIEHGMKELSS